VKYIEKDTKKTYLGLRELSLTLVSPFVGLRWPTLDSASSPSSAVPSLAYFGPRWPVVGFVRLLWAFVDLRWASLGCVGFRFGDVGGGGGGSVRVAYFK
jgi:hypothetical protein